MARCVFELPQYWRGGSVADYKEPVQYKSRTPNKLKPTITPLIESPVERI